MWFWEELNFMSRWAPVKSDDKPRLRKDGRLDRRDGFRPLVRNLAEIKPEHETLLLRELEKIYGQR
jgi:hypothetical protein